LKTLLIIGYTFPEPTTTAAGGRMMQLIDLFLEENYKITFASTAKASEWSTDLSALGISTESIELNNSSFDSFICQLKPSVVLFDRYITEEQFGWRVSEHCPDALKLLDTEDLHFLRKARQEAVKAMLPVSEANLFSDTAKRELASILRCDLSLIISQFELALLQKTFRIPSEILYYLPFLVDKTSKESKKEYCTFEEREGFVTIGNLHHAPNVDSLHYLKKEIWPFIKKQLPEAQLFIFGNYAPQQIKELNNPKDDFIFKGWTPRVSDVMLYGKVCLAPLRFGAGLKGKLFDAMVYGLPSVTTTIGAEGLYGELPIPGFVRNNPLEFADASVALYTTKSKWLKAHENGFKIIEERFQKQLFSESFKECLIQIKNTLQVHRNYNFIGQVLHYQTLLSTKYMSKWIEGKSRIQTNDNSSAVCFENSDEVRSDYKISNTKSIPDSTD